MASLNIITAIRSRCDPAAFALIQGQNAWTYAELFHRCDAIASELPQAPHPLRIGLHHPSGMDYVATAMAVLAAGHCFVPIPEELSASERDSLLQRTNLQGLITQGADGIKYEKLHPGPCRFSQMLFCGLNPAFIRFSSGTTGQSKGVVLSHESLLARISSANAGLGIGPTDRILWTLPMSHHFAVSIVLYLYFGATTVLEEVRLGADLLRAGNQKRATVMYASPSQYRQLTAAVTSTSGLLTQLRLAVSTAAALDLGTAARFTQMFGTPLQQALGIIELGLPLLNTTSDGLESVGTPQPGFEASLLHCDADGIGQLCLRGPGMFDAYLDPWQTRKQALTADGWFNTGDLAKQDAAGRYFLKGRSTSVINVGGMKVFPEEVEAHLLTLVGIKRCLVRTKVHALYGELPEALIEPSEDASIDVKALRLHCQKTLSVHKVPVAFHLVDSLPTTASGKLLRHNLP